MSEIFLLFPHQLFKASLKLGKERVISMVEEESFFHKGETSRQKLIVQRASMQALRERLLVKGYEVHYFDSASFSNLEKVIKVLKKEGFSQVVHYNLYGTLAEKLTTFLKQAGLGEESVESPGNIVSETWLRKYLTKESRPSVRTFSEALVNHLGFTSSGTVTTLAKQSAKLPLYLEPDRYIDEAIEYVRTNFSNNPGTLANPGLPITYADAEDWLEAFVSSRLQGGSKRQDEVLEDILNLGLLTSEQVVSAVRSYIENNKKAAPAAAGFIQEMIGQREFERLKSLLV